MHSNYGKAQECFRPLISNDGKEEKKKGSRREKSKADETSGVLVVNPGGWSARDGTTHRPRGQPQEEEERHEQRR